MDFQIKKYFINFIYCNKALITQVSKLESPKLGSR
jgi:hypothetical protein